MNCLRVEMFFISLGLFRMGKRQRLHGVLWGDVWVLMDMTISQRFSPRDLPRNFTAGVQDTPHQCVAVELQQYPEQGFDFHSLVRLVLWLFFFFFLSFGMMLFEVRRSLDEKRKFCHLLDLDLSPSSPSRYHSKQECVGPLTSLHRLSK